MASHSSESRRWSRRRLLKSVPAVVASAAVRGHEPGLLPLVDSSAASSEPRESIAPRQRTLLNADWRFCRADVPGAEATHFDDKEWERIGLPHSFGMPYFGTPGFYVGYGWYRKHLRMEPIPRGQRVALEFEAAFQDAEVFVNGTPVGRHLGGYTGFCFDITDALRSGENTIAVRLNNNWNAQLNPRAGEHNFNGGIYRNVYLVRTSDLCVDWYGAFVTTPGLRKAGGPVHLAVEVQNSSTRTRRFSLMTDIVDAKNRIVGSVSSEETIDGNTTKAFEHLTPEVAWPELWSPAHPNLYAARIQIFEAGRRVDVYTTSFGFRWFRWTAEKGFFLNGEHYYFKGTNVHQDHAGWGDGVTNDGIARDIRLVKQAGMDFIRGSHYPHSPIFSDECDRQGIMLWSENCFWGTGGARREGFWTASAYPPNEKDQKPFEENVKRSLREMIRIHRNHPSIIAWSMGNEVFFSDSNLLPKIRSFLPELVQVAHQMDPTRPAGMGGVQRGNLDRLTDIAGYNGDGATLFMNPGVPNVVTEYGSVESIRPGAYDPGWGDMTGQPEFSWRSGQALWCAFDHGSIFPNLGRTGMVDYFRLPKRQWDWYRNAYAGVAPPDFAEPGISSALRLRTDAPGRAIRADGTGDMQIIVSVVDAAGKRISNSPPVQLEILAGPGEFPTGRSITFSPDSDIAIRDGEAAMELRSYQSGLIHVRATSPGLASADLMVRAEGGPTFVPGITPIAEDRPYISPPAITLEATRPIDISLNHPTAASSSASGHSGRMANDGNESTYWEPVQGKGSENWWQVDFESLCMVKSVHLSLGSKAAYRYVIQYADREGNWKVLIDQSANTSEMSQFTERIPNTIVTRFLRVVFSSIANGKPIQLFQVQVLGTPVL